jgi:hypothetical protein
MRKDGISERMTLKNTARTATARAAKVTDGGQKQLAKSPADLIKLSKNNGGVFPIVKLYNVIDGRVEVLTHGGREMPAWGQVYARELQARMPREYPPEGVDQLVRERILTIVEYLLAVQEK